MDRGVLTIETDYSDSDFKVEWLEVLEVYSDVNYLITLSDGRRLNGKIRSAGDGNIRIDYYSPGRLIPKKKKDPTPDTETPEEAPDMSVTVAISEIVYLDSLDSGFWSRLSAYIDFGWSLTRANNLQQVNLRSGLGYTADRWKANANINILNSTQDEVDDVSRTDADLSFNYFLPKDWFLSYNLTFLANNEQLIDLRTGNKIGIGHYITRTNQTYFAFQVGANFNNETFLDETPQQQSGEGFIGAELNLYDIGDLSLLTNLAMYPSFTQSGRFRTDYRLDVKYEFLDDFYVKLGTTLNFDNQAVGEAPNLDYIIQTTVGWEL